MALDLPDAVRAALPAPPPPFRALAPESLHVTLAFLGWLAEEDVARVGDAIAPPPPGVLSFAEAVLLPPRRPRVMAVRLDDPSGACRRCQASVAQGLAAAGLYAPEERPWLPHVTIGRAREPVRGVPLPALPSRSFTPSSVTLYRSRPSAGGTRYEALRTWRV